MPERSGNRLAKEASPYLLQHAHNPVDWYPWGEAAMAEARSSDRPIFLSVGYAACHWCHVMERESFEDEEVAAFLNEHFVPVKVDREERPDVDGIYMDAVQAMTGQGGWPMSVWLTPDGRPFYAGTYFPDEPRHGMPSFRQVLQGLAEAWSSRRDEIEAQSGRVTQAIAGAARLVASDDPLGNDIEQAAEAALRRDFDSRWGGFGRAPKFPQPMTLEFLLRMALRETPDALEMVVLTLDRMADGGIHDQVGGGFARYSTDERWHVPHFEKMLYDNAQLAQLYTHAWLVTRNRRYRDVAERTLDYLIREMRHPDGAFYSSQDADSEGVEGRYFVWGWDELVDLVGEPAAAAFGAAREGNWEGTNVLWHPVPLAGVADGVGMSVEELETTVGDARPKLFEARERRIKPGTDDKILAGWNGLAIRAFAEAGRALGVARYVTVAEEAAIFVWEHLRDEAGRLLRAWRRGVTRGQGFADDHAALGLAFLTLYEATADPVWFDRARGLGDVLVERFMDAENGGFFMTADDAEELVMRPKELYDNAVPSGSSLAAELLQRLTLFTGEPSYERAGVSALRLVRDALGKAPTAFGHALSALDLYLGPSREIAIIGDPDEPRTRELLNEVVRERWLPNVVYAVARPGRSDGVALLEDREQRDGVPTAFVCERFACRLPTADPTVLAEQLASSIS